MGDTFVGSVAGLPAACACCASVCRSRYAALAVDSLLLLPTWVAATCAPTPAPATLPSAPCRRLSPELRQRVRQRWAAFYKDFDYPLDDEEEAVADQ